MNVEDRAPEKIQNCLLWRISNFIIIIKFCECKSKETGLKHGKFIGFMKYIAENSPGRAFEINFRLLRL